MNYYSMQLVKVLVSLLVLFYLVEDVCSQRIRFPEEEYNSNDVDQGCPRGSRCIEINRCRSNVLRSIGGEPRECGYSYNWRRRICCPDGTGRASRTGRPNPTRARPTSPPRRTISIPRRPNSAPERPVAATQPPVSVPRAPVPRGPRRGNSNGECGRSLVANPLQGLVMGGEEAQTGAWPWMVVISRLERTGDLSPWCTGFLISRRHVLSAAHCFDRRNASLYAAMVGSVESSQGEVYRVSRVAVPEGYTRGQFYDDIALLTLTRDVEGDNFRAICLPRSREFRNMTGTGTTVAGWGATRVGGDMSPRLRQLSYMPVISYPRCNQMFSERLSNFQRQFPRGITSQFVCAGFIDESGKDSCGGDSGAPLMLQENDQWYAIGIVSFGFACGRQGYPGGYTRVSHYLNWIERNTQS